MRLVLDLVLSTLAVGLALLIAALLYLGCSGWNAIAGAGRDPWFLVSLAGTCFIVVLQVPVVSGTAPGAAGWLRRAARLGMGLIGLGALVLVSCGLLMLGWGAPRALAEARDVWSWCAYVTDESDAPERLSVLVRPPADATPDWSSGTVARGTPAAGVPTARELVAAPGSATGSLRLPGRPAEWSWEGTHRSEAPTTPGASPGAAWPPQPGLEQPGLDLQLKDASGSLGSMMDPYAERLFIQWRGVGNRSETEAGGSSFPALWGFGNGNPGTALQPWAWVEYKGLTPVLAGSADHVSQLGNRAEGQVAASFLHRWEDMVERRRRGEEPVGVVWQSEPTRRSGGLLSWQWIVPTWVAAVSLGVAGILVLLRLPGPPPRWSASQRPRT